MSDEIYERIRRHPKYADMVARRRLLAFSLSAIVLGALFGMILVAAFQPQVLKTPLSEGSPVTVAVPVGILIIIGSWLLTGVYTRRARRDFDELSNQIVREVTKK